MKRLLPALVGLALSGCSGHGADGIRCRRRWTCPTSSGRPRRTPRSPPRPASPARPTSSPGVTLSPPAGSTPRSRGRPGRSREPSCSSPMTTGGKPTSSPAAALFQFPGSDRGSGHADDGTLILWSRSVYGRSDLGVNKARLRAWLAALDARPLTCILRSIDAQPRDRSSATSGGWRKPYFRSEERWSARGLLLAIVATEPRAGRRSNVVLNFWNNAFFNALQDKDWNSFSQLLLTWKRHAERLDHAGLRAAWCRRLHRHCGLPRPISRSAADPLAALADRPLPRRLARRPRLLPDQPASAPPTGAGPPPRTPTSASPRTCATSSATASAALAASCSSASTCCPTSSRCSASSPSSGRCPGRCTVLGVDIPGYMVWVALIYAGVGTWLTHLVGRPLVDAQLLQAARRGGFPLRPGAAAREHRGRRAVRRRGARRSAACASGSRRWSPNWLGADAPHEAAERPDRRLWPGRRHLPADRGRAPLSSPASSRWAALTQTAGAFGEVQGSLSWFVDNYQRPGQLARHRRRLATFYAAIDRPRARRRATGVPARVRGGRRFALARRDHRTAGRAGAARRHRPRRFRAGPVDA